MSFAESSLPLMRHLLACEQVSFNAENPLAPYSVHGVLTVLQPESGRGYPMTYPVIWLFAQFHGDPGDYEVWVDFVRIDEETEDDSEVATYGPWLLIIHADLFVESRGWRLLNVPFSEPGSYEFRIRCGADVLAAERLWPTEA